MCSGGRTESYCFWTNLQIRHDLELQKERLKERLVREVSVLEAGFLLRRLQKGSNVGMPQARPMPSVGRRCRELRIRDENKNWRNMVRIDEDAVVVVDVFEKKTRTTPAKVIAVCKDRLKRYGEIVKG
jgi:phage-related protein